MIWHIIVYHTIECIAVAAVALASKVFSRAEPASKQTSKGPGASVSALSLGLLLLFVLTYVYVYVCVYIYIYICVVLLSC